MQHKFFHAKTLTDIFLNDHNINKVVPTGSLVVVFPLNDGSLAANDGEHNFIIEPLEFTKATIH